jgi:hypothetical protein
MTTTTQGTKSSELKVRQPPSTGRIIFFTCLCIFGFQALFILFEPNLILMICIVILTVWSMIDKTDKALTRLPFFVWPLVLSTIIYFYDFFSGGSFVQFLDPTYSINNIHALFP